MHRLGFICVVTLLALTQGLFAQSQTLQINGTARTYVLHVPTGVPAKPTLMFVLCGHGMTGAQQESSTQMDLISNREKFIVVYPDAIAQNWDQTGNTDFVFFLALLDTLTAKYHVDPERVYVAGFSQGAGMTHAFGCGYADKIAAIAPVSGNIPTGCAPKRPISMFVTFGTNDIYPAATFLAGAQTWANLDSCPATPVVTRPYPANRAKSVVTRIAWGPCKNGTMVIADSIHGGPHEWPMDTVTKVNNSEEVWAFLKQFTLSGSSTAVSRGNIHAVHAGVSAYYAGGIIRLNGLRKPSRVWVLDEKGRQVATGQSVQTQFKLNGVPGGVYQVRVDGGDGKFVSIKIIVP